MQRHVLILGAVLALSLASRVAAQMHEHKPGEGLEGVTRPPAARQPSGGSAAPS